MRIPCHTSVYGAYGWRGLDCVLTDEHPAHRGHAVLEVVNAGSSLHLGAFLAEDSFPAVYDETGKVQVSYEFPVRLSYLHLDSKPTLEEAAWLMESVFGTHLERERRFVAGFQTIGWLSGAEAARVALGYHT